MFTRRNILLGAAGGVTSVFLAPHIALADTAPKNGGLTNEAMNTLVTYFDRLAATAAWTDTGSAGSFTDLLVASRQADGRVREAQLRSAAQTLKEVNGGYVGGGGSLQIYSVTTVEPGRVVVYLSHFGEYAYPDVPGSAGMKAYFDEQFNVELLASGSSWLIGAVTAIHRDTPLLLPPTVLDSDPYVAPLEGSSTATQSSRPASRSKVSASNRTMAAAATDPSSDPTQTAPPDSYPMPVDSGPIDGLPGPSSEATGAAPSKAMDPDSTKADGTVGSYNYAAMVSYANQWGKLNVYNPAYPRWGDDCTNFVSQCMRAGGWAISGGAFRDRSNYRFWFYHDPSSSSYSWAGAQNWRNFAWYAGRFTPLSSIWQMGGGDVLGWDNSHSGVLNHLQVCVGTTGSDPYMAQHTDGYTGLKLSTIIAKNSSNQNAIKYAHRT